MRQRRTCLEIFPQIFVIYRIECQFVIQHENLLSVTTFPVALKEPFSFTVHAYIHAPRESIYFPFEYIENVTYIKCHNGN